MKKNYKSLDDLILGIKQLASEDRCSFSTAEKDLLNRCVFMLTEYQDTLKTGKLNLAPLSQVIEILGRLVVIGDYFKDVI